MPVSEYENNKVYTLLIGSVANGKSSEIGQNVCEKFYPKEKPKKFWYGD